MKTFLHVGCGSKRQDQTTPEFASENWREVRFDIDESVKPDLLGTMLDMASVTSASMDAIFSSHNIEHLYPHEVPLALAEFYRVLSADGIAVITCPDLKSVCALVVQDKLVDPAYSAPAGQIAPIDILYGYRKAMANGNLFMAHRCGFTESVLRQTLLQAGFATVITMARGRAPYFDLWAAASKSQRNEYEMRALGQRHFPVGSTAKR